MVYKNDDMDKEEDDDFWDGKKKVKHEFTKGSKEYGHIILDSDDRAERREGENRKRFIVTRGGREREPLVSGSKKYIDRHNDSDSDDDVKSLKNKI